MYILTVGTNIDYTPEVKLFRTLKRAKEALRKRYDEYMTEPSYHITEQAKKEAEQDFEDNKHMGFLIELPNFELMECHIEEINFSD